MEFVFYSPTKVVFAPGAMDSASDHITGRRVFIVTDKNMVKLGLVKRLTDSLEKSEVKIFDEVDPNPSDTSVDKAADIARRWGADTVVGFGGGSPMDVAKGAACLATNGGKLSEYRRGGTRIFEKPGIPIVCIPTTAGTGSEVTFAGVYSFVEYGFKAGIVTPHFYPKIAIVDPELTYSVPPRITAATGLDALTHAMESYIGNKHTPQSDGMALVAIKAVLENLEVCVNTGEHTARENMAMASLVASHASSQAEIGLGHAAGYPITELYHLEHGFACAMFLPYEMTAAAQFSIKRMELLAAYCGLGSTEKLSFEICNLLVKCGCPTKLSDIGFKSEDENKIISDTMGARYIQNTPGGMTRENLSKIIDSMV